MDSYILQDKDISHCFWVEVVNCANYLLNRISNRFVPSMNPVKWWYRKKPSIGHLYVFRCVSSAHIPDYCQKKLDAKIHACIMMGYSEYSKAYNYLILFDGRLLFDVMFGLMRSLLVLSSWIIFLDCCRMIPLMVSLTLVILFHYSVLQIDSLTFSLFRLDCQPLSWLVDRMKTLWFLIDLLKWIEVHLFLVYLYGMPRQLNLLELMLEISPPDDKLEVKSNMLVFPWWFVYLKLLIFFSTQRLKDNLNESIPCKHKLILFRRITLGT